LVLTKYEHENGWTVTNDIVLTSARQDDIIADIDRDIAAHGYLSVIVKAQAIGLPYQFVQKVFKLHALFRFQFVRSDVQF
jgi:hypothetical protein